IKGIEQIARGKEFGQETRDALFRLDHDVYAIASAHHERDPSLNDGLSKLSGELGKVARHNWVLPRVRRGLDAFSRREEAARQSVRSLLEDIEKADLDYRKKTDPEGYAYLRSVRDVFASRWQRIGWFWATLLFEWLF